MESDQRCDADPHKAEHRRFIDTVAQLQELVRRNRDRASVLAAVVSAVEKWVVGHVMRSDHKLADFIRERREA